MKRIVLLSIVFVNLYSSDIDVTLIGRVKFADGLGRLVIGLTDVLKDDLSINHVQLPKKDCYDFTHVSPDIEAVIKNPDKTPGKVSLLLFPLWWKQFSAADCVPESHIKIAYSMVESTKVPDKWVEILNERFDAVVVPDEFYQGVYTDSGVAIPVFVIPHGIYIEDFLQEPLRQRDPSQPFVFGISAGFWPRKNQDLLLEAFCAEFKNDSQVRLVMQGRSGNRSYEKKLHKKIKKLGLTNSTLIKSSLTDQEYKDLMKSFDCYVLVSKAEGFSVTPKESLALGIPTIITDNTAHKTLCKSGYVYAVPSEIRQPATYIGLGLGECGDDFNCTVEDARKALREVYDNYEDYQNRAIQGREWIKRYLWSSLKGTFRNLVKPTKILLGTENVVTDDYLMTTSEELFRKYQQLNKEDYE